MLEPGSLCITRGSAMSLDYLCHLALNFEEHFIARLLLRDSPITTQFIGTESIPLSHSLVFRKNRWASQYAPPERYVAVDAIQSLSSNISQRHSCPQSCVRRSDASHDSTQATLSPLSHLQNHQPNGSGLLYCDSPAIPQGI